MTDVVALLADLVADFPPSDHESPALRAAREMTWKDSGLPPMRHRNGQALTPDEYHTVTHASPDEYAAAADVIRAEAAAPRGARVVAAVFTIRGEAKVPTNRSSVRAMVIEVTKQTFNSDVVQRSRTTPVIVYLWAKWCGPCKQLGPVLEKLAAEAGGQWILAKVDTDANLSAPLKVQEQKLPMVMAFVGGQLMKGFHGAMPEAQLRQWLSQVPATAEKNCLQADRDGSRFTVAEASREEPAALKAKLARDSLRQQQAAQSGGSAAAGGVVVNVTEKTFNTDVVRRSRTTPVIIYLWAKWCGPCKQLGPVLEKLAAEAGGQWILAKVDIDANPQLSTALKVQELPMVVAVAGGQLAGGQLVDGFLGVIPESRTRRGSARSWRPRRKRACRPIVNWPPGAPGW